MIMSIDTHLHILMFLRHSTSFGTEVISVLLEHWNWIINSNPMINNYVVHRLQLIVNTILWWKQCLLTKKKQQCVNSSVRLTICSIIFLVQNLRYVVVSNLLSTLSGAGMNILQSSVARRTNFPVSGPVCSANRPLPRNPRRAVRA